LFFLLPLRVFFFPTKACVSAYLCAWEWESLVDVAVTAVVDLCFPKKGACLDDAKLGWCTSRLQMINDEAAAFIVMILKRFDFSVTVLFLNPLHLFLTSYCYVLVQVCLPQDWVLCQLSVSIFQFAILKRFCESMWSNGYYNSVLTVVQRGIELVQNKLTFGTYLGPLVRNIFIMTVSSSLVEKLPLHFISRIWWLGIFVGLGNSRHSCKTL